MVRVTTWTRPIRLVTMRRFVWRSVDMRWRSRTSTVGARIEYLYERGYLSMAKLGEVERDEYAPY